MVPITRLQLELISQFIFRRLALEIFSKCQCRDVRTESLFVVYWKRAALVIARQQACFFVQEICRLCTEAYGKAFLRAVVPSLFSLMDPFDDLAKSCGPL